MKTVLVLGNARSGTSMTAGIIFFLGVNIDHVHKPNAQNPNGAFESEIWNSITSRMHLEIQNGKSKAHIASIFIPEIKKEIAKKQNETWGWKSAVTHWNLDLFLPYLSNPHLVIVTRNIIDNAKSWQTHMRTNYGQNVTFEHALDNMAESTRVLIKNVNAVDCPKLWTTYESLKIEPLKEAENLANFLNIDMTKNMRDKISSFIIPNFSTIKTNA